MQSRLFTKCIIWAIFVALLLGCGCGSCVPAPNRHVTRQIQKTEIVGRWELRSNSLLLLTRDGFVSDPSHEYTIDFRADGTFTFKSVVDDFRSSVYIETDGVWSLEHDTRGGSNIKRANAIRFEIQHPTHSNLVFFNFTEDSGVLTLWNYYGDPDEWEFIECDFVPTEHVAGED